MAEPTEPTSTLTFADLYKAVSEYLGTGLSPSGTALTNAKRYTNEGYRRFRTPVDPRTGLGYEWRFLSVATTIAVADGDTDLPIDFARLVDAPTFGATGPSSEIIMVEPEYLLEMKAGSTATGTIRYAAVRYKSGGLRCELLVYPTPSAPVTLNYTYRINPPDLSVDGDIPYGGGMHSGTIRAMCLAAAEQTANDGQTEKTEHAKVLLAASIDLDRRLP
ncbi:MAG: hypothetical protein GXY83_15680 [Rhodopirellula sp.]|nr:hypothetical protein [Rhodopirellula sp.]